MAMQLINVISQSTTFDKHHLTVVTLVLVLHILMIFKLIVSFPSNFLPQNLQINFSAFTDFWWALLRRPSSLLYEGNFKSQRLQKTLWGTLKCSLKAPVLENLSWHWPHFKSNPTLTPCTSTECLSWTDFSTKDMSQFSHLNSCSISSCFKHPSNSLPKSWLQNLQRKLFSVWSAFVWFVRECLLRNFLSQYLQVKSCFSSSWAWYSGYDFWKHLPQNLQTKSKSPWRALIWLRGKLF